MAKLRIPESHRVDLALLLALDDVQLQAFTRALDTAIVTSATEFAAKANIPNVAAADLAKMFGAIRALYTVRNHDNTAIPEFAESLVEAIRSSGDANLAAYADRADLKERLARLLSAASFSVSVKAQDLSAEFERTAYGVRVFTDLRPVFRDTVAEPLAGMVIMHTLKVEYHIHDYQHQSLYITLPHEQLLSLQTAIARALEKEKTLEVRLRDGGITQLGKAES